MEERIPREYDTEEVSSEPVYALNDPSFLSMRIDPKETLMIIKQSLLGYVFKDGEWVKGGSPVISEEGADLLTTTLLLYVNIPNIFADFNDDQINYKMVSFSNALLETLATHETEWKIKAISLVQEAIENFVHGVLTRARNRGEAKSIGVMTAVQKTSYKADEKKSRIPFLGSGK